MFIKKKREWDSRSSEITEEDAFRNRRRFIKALGLGSIAGAGLVVGARELTKVHIKPQPKIEGYSRNSDFLVPERKETPEDPVFRFNNFYEFSLSKTAVAWKAKDFSLDPWTLKIDGLVNNPTTIGMEDLLKMNLEERVYRFRCVETWAMTVPWVGIPLSKLLQLADPKKAATHVLIKSFFEPVKATRQQSSSFPWPYKEALTIEEAMNPLAFAAVGLYGRHLQPQNGAPMRVVLPWKYGFKGPKSVVGISLVNYRPQTFWNSLQPGEYGFYGNVNPDFPHPRWSQKSETLIGTWGKRLRTQKYNGYQEWVSKLYKGDEY